MIKENQNKDFTFKLSNGNEVTLTPEDVKANNIDKLRKQIPELKIANKLSNKNPLKKVISTLEDGIQIKKTYYKVLSGFFLFYIWLIQILALYYKSPSALSMLLISFWTTYAIIRLQIRPYFKISTLKNLVFRKDVSIIISSTTYFLVIVSCIYSILTPNILCSDISLKSIFTPMIKVNTINYLSFFFLSVFSVSLLNGFYNIYEFYEKNKLTLLLKKETVSSKAIMYILFFGTLLLTPLVYNNLICSHKETTFEYTIISLFFYLLLSTFFCNFFAIIFSILRSVALKINSNYL